MDEILLHALKSYFKAEGIKVSMAELELQLFSHPHTPSLLAVTETLDFLSLDNLAAQIDKNQFASLPEHFIAFVEEDEEDPYFIHAQKIESKVIFHTQSGSEEYLEDSFMNRWNGIILLVEQGDDSLSHNSVAWSNIQYIVLTGLAIAILWSNGLSILFALLGIIGLFISNTIFEITQDMGTSSRLGKLVCRHSLESQCNTVLNSNRQKIGAFTLNDILFAFFSTGIITLFVYSEPSIIHYLGYSLAIVGICGTIFIQAFVLKSWCKLCLMATAVIILQIFILLFLVNLAELPRPNLLRGLSDLLTYVFIFIGVLISIFLVRKDKVKIYDSKIKEIELTKFKRSPDVIFSIMKGAKGVMGIEEIDHLSFGCDNAPNTITLVISPTCIHCKDAFEKFNLILRKKNDDHRFVIIFNLFNTSHNKNTEMIASMINAYDKSPNDFLTLLSMWFESMDNDTFCKNHVTNFLQTDYDLLVQQRKWCESNELYYTPALIINDRVVPDEYDISFLEDILTAKEARQ